MEEGTIREYFAAFPDMIYDEIAVLLGVGVRTLHIKLKQYNINPKEIRKTENKNISGC